MKNQKKISTIKTLIKEPAKYDAISANLMFSENAWECAHIVQSAKVYHFYEMKTKSKKHKNIIETHTSA